MGPLALALGANTLLVAWLALERPGTKRVIIAPSMIWMEPLPDDLRIPASDKPASTKVVLREKKPAVQWPQPAMDAPTTIVESLAPTTSAEPAAPPIDWKSALGQAVRDHLASEAATEKGSILDSKPQAMELPREKDRPHQLGDSETRGAYTIVWLNERCYLESGIFDQHSMPRTVCKRRSMAERRSEERADAIEQAVKQKRGGGSAGP
jgi:hypothetical protein